jgi:hypothetical protein
VLIGRAQEKARASSPGGVRRLIEASLPHLTGTATSLLDGILSSYDLAKEVGEMIDLTFTDPSLAKLSEENSNGYQ